MNEEPAAVWPADIVLVGRLGDDGGGGAAWVTEGVILRNDLKPT